MTVCETSSAKNMSMKFLMFTILSFLFLVTGCAQHTANMQPVIEKPVYLKCQIPEIPRAELEPISENASYPVKLQIILNNCLKIQRENELLREALKLCQ